MRTPEIDLSGAGEDNKKERFVRWLVRDNGINVYKKMEDTGWYARASWDSPPTPEEIAYWGPILLDLCRAKYSQE